MRRVFLLIIYALADLDSELPPRHAERHQATSVQLDGGLGVPGSPSACCGDSARSQSRHQRAVRRDLSRIEALPSVSTRKGGPVRDAGGTKGLEAGLAAQVDAKSSW